MTMVLKISFAALLMVSSTAFAQGPSTDAELTARSSCRARAIERYYCPTGFGDWWGPYWDNGCSVKCAQGQTAVCETATCEEGQTGRPVPSSCTCE